VGKYEKPMSAYRRRPTQSQIISSFLPKIKSIAISLKTTLPKNVELNDLIQEGVIGLLGVIERYDPEKGASFSTYAMKRIKGAMYDYLRSIDWIPRKTRHMLKEVEKAYMSLEGELNRIPTESEIAEYVGVTEDEVKHINSEMSRRQLLNLDGFINEDDEDFTELISSDSFNPEENFMEEEMMAKLSEEISRLKDREKLLLSLYYVEELNFKEVAEVLGVTESRISQIHSGIMIKLKKRMKEVLGNE